MFGLTAFKKFCTSEDGAVTVDWVVLTAATLGLCLLLMGTFYDAIFGAGGMFVSNLDAAITEAATINPAN